MVRLGLLRRSPRDRDEDKRETEEEEQPAVAAKAGPPLILLVPDIAGVSSFRWHAFMDGGSAAEFIGSSLSAAARRAVHAFWALPVRPLDTPADSGDEAIVLIRAEENSNLVSVVSFVDIESAQSFARFEAKRGLNPGLLMIYWAVLANITETEDGIHLTPTEPLQITPEAWASATATAPPQPTLDETRLRQEEEKRRLQEELRRHQAEAEQRNERKAQEENRQRQAEDEAKRRRLEAEAREIESLKAEAEALNQQQAQAAERDRREAEERKRQAEAEEKQRLEAAAEEKRRLAAELEATKRQQAEAEEKRRLAAELEATKRQQAEAEEHARHEAQERNRQTEVEEKRRIEAVAEEKRQLAAGLEAMKLQQAEADERARHEAQTPVDGAELTGPPPEADDTIVAPNGSALSPIDQLLASMPRIRRDDALDIPLLDPADPEGEEDEAAAPTIADVTDSPAETSGNGDSESADVAAEVQKLLRTRRWQTRQQPFEGFKSPPGRF